MKKFSAVLMTIVAMVSLSFAQIPSQGLVSWISFTGNNSDSCGNINFLTQIFGTPPALVPDRFSVNNRAYTLTSNVSFMAINSNNIPSGNSSRTISMWVNRNNIVNPFSTFFYIGKKQTGKFLNFGVRISSEGTYVYAKNGIDSLKVLAISDETTGMPCFPANTWKHVVLVINNDTTIFYQNGKEWARKVINTWASTNDTLGIGGIPSSISVGTNSSNALEGKIDDIAIYNKALSPTQITRLFASGSFRNTSVKFTSTPDTNALLNILYRYNTLTTNVSKISIISAPAGLYIFQNKVQWIPAQTGVFNVSILATDSSEDTSSQSYNINVVIPTSVVKNIHTIESKHPYTKNFNVSGRLFVGRTKNGVFITGNNKSITFN